LAERLYRNQLISEDGRVAGMVARTSVPAEEIVDGIDFREPLTDRVRAAVTPVLGTRASSRCLPGCAAGPRRWASRHRLRQPAHDHGLVHDEHDNPTPTLCALF
jgi:hypothetical protein